MLTLIPSVWWSNDNVLVISVISYLIIVAPSGYSQDCHRVQCIPISCRERRIIDQLGPRNCRQHLLEETPWMLQKPVPRIDKNWKPAFALNWTLTSLLVLSIVTLKKWRHCQKHAETTLKSHAFLHAENHFTWASIPTAGHFRHGVGFCCTSSCGRPCAGQRLSGLERQLSMLRLFQIDISRTTWRLLGTMIRLTAQHKGSSLKLSIIFVFTVAVWFLLVWGVCIWLAVQD